METLEDPRLEAMDAWRGFVLSKVRLKNIFPLTLTSFEIKIKRGNYYDSRLEPFGLQARGVELSWISLI